MLHRLSVLLLVGALLTLGGCIGAPDLPLSGTPGLPTDVVPLNTPPATPAPPTTPPTAPPSPSLAPPSPTAANGAPALKVEEVATGLEVPWSLVFDPDGRLFFTERPGRVRVIVRGHLLAEPVVLVEGVKPSGEGGLMGITLDPQFATNHYLYVYHTYDASGQTRNRLVRYVEAAQKASSLTVLFDGVLGAGIHDGGRIKFGPDGKLYLTAGDASNSSLAQDRAALAGKILRLNADGSIPSDNPFGTAIWSYGHRNPQGLSWQPGTDRLYETEHGPSGHDEVNLVEKGQNYGWPTVTDKAGRPEFVDPLLTSGEPPSWAPSGAAFGTAPWLGAWQGNFFFATLRGEHLHRVVLDPADPRRIVSDEKLFEGVYGRLRDVVQGPDGLYFSTSNRDGRGTVHTGDDRILRLVPATP